MSGDRGHPQLPAGAARLPQDAGEQPDGKLRPPRHPGRPTLDTGQH